MLLASNAPQHLVCVLLLYCYSRSPVKYGTMSPRVMPKLFPE